MKRLTVVSAGLGADTVTAEALRAVERAQVLFGAPRLLALFGGAACRCEPVYTPEKIAPVLAEYKAGEFAVLVSGDAGFFSAAARLRESLADCEVEILPGVSSLNAFAARLGLSWQEMAAVSCHGRDGRLVDTVRRSRYTFALTGGNVPQLAQALCRAGFGELTVHVGEELGLPQERVRAMTVSALQTAETAPLTVLVIENGAPDGRCRTGIPDDEFLRGEVPMTKAEVRAVSMSKLAVAPDDVCWDVGCGTGSVTVELALAAWRGGVWAVDRDEAAVSLTRRNCEKFHVGNATVSVGSAPEALAEFPAPDTVFIGGSGRRMDGVFDAALAKNPRARIVVNAIALESVQSALNAFAGHGIPASTVQLSVSAARETAGLHMMLAQNPIYIISGGGKDE